MKLLKNDTLIKYIFAFVSILNFFSIYYFVPSISNIINLVWQMSLLYLFYKASKKIPLKLLNRLFIFCIIFVSIVGVSLLFYYIRHSYPIKYIVVYLVNPLMLVSFFLVSHKDIWIKIENIMIVLSIISLIFWILYTIGVSPTSSMSVSLGDKFTSIPSYFNIDFFPQIGNNFLGNTIARNSGMFNEPAYYAYPLCIALFIEMFLRHHNNGKRFSYRFFILCITILTTTSTSGIIVAIISITYYICITTRNNIFRGIIIVIIPFIVVLLKLIISYKRGNTTSMTSYTVRSNDVYSALMDWKRHLLFGNGIKNKNSIFQYMYSFRNNMGSSTGFLNSLAYGGIWGSLFYIFPTILSLLCSKYIFGIALGSFILFLFVPVDTAYMYIMILSYFWACFLIYFMNNNQLYL